MPPLQLYHHLSDSSDEEQKLDLRPPPFCPRLDQLGVRPPLGLDQPKPHLLSMIVIRLLPIGATVSWLVTLLLLLWAWVHLDSRAQYRWYLGSFPFLSNVGAEHPHFFQLGCLATALFFTASLAAERILRSRRVMMEATEEKVLWVSVGVMDSVVGAFGGLSLIGVSLYDCVQHPRLHQIFMIYFILAIAVSGTLQTVETRHLWHEHPDRADLLAGTLLKSIFLGFAVACGAGYWVFYYICDGDATKEGRHGFCHEITTTSAVLEWAACFFCAFYLATLIVDVWPAYRHTPLQHPCWSNASHGVIGVHVAQPGGGYIPFHLPFGQERVSGALPSRSMYGDEEGERMIEEELGEKQRREQWEGQKTG